jgi:hypothetical protein
MRRRSWVGDVSGMCVLVAAERRRGAAGSGGRFPLRIMGLAFRVAACRSVRAPAYYAAENNGTGAKHAPVLPAHWGLEAFNGAVDQRWGALVVRPVAQAWPKVV